ncbi:mechanosensitive ion channel family protein [Lampropedia aestuarii]|uniref:mechanosensitive ion channel family protein n=1 Tax=Lampropedia aestuarii TaxID=2562762 RepID=UPI002468ADE9|nr:mechanosensitive ion channel family protein [Lampropedia aestuarii]MDH5858171.1 mechanosensitive ion channel family protein [Lampropedia aestuarii]
MPQYDDSLKYLYGLALLLVVLALAACVTLAERRHRNWSKSITVHGIQCLFFLAAIGISRYFSLEAIDDYHLSWITSGFVNLVAVALSMGVLMQKMSLLINRLQRAQISKGHDPTSARIVSRMMKFGVFMVLVLLFGEHFGLSVSGLLAFGGIGGLAIGMASKDILSNVFSGTMLYFDRQFNIGDWIRSPDRQIEGTVEEIGWRLTKITTFDNRPLFVPNALFSSISIENPGRMTNRRINAEIGLRYEDAGKVRAIVTDIRQMLAQRSDIDQTQTTLVYFNAFADSSLNIMVYCFTKTTNWAKWLEAQQDIYLDIIDIVHQHGADFAFPSQTLYMEKTEDDKADAAKAD